MRKRSGGIHAETQESYLKMALLIQSREDKENSMANSNRNPVNLNSSLRRITEVKFQEDRSFTFDSTGSPNKSPNFDEFDFDLEKPVLEKHNSPSALSLDAILTGNSTDLESMESRIEKIEKSYKVMVIGGRNTGKHSLINALFAQTGEDSDVLESNKNCFDLMIKHKEDFLSKKTYQFWIREVPDNRYTPLIQIYYKSVQMFVFVYSIDDRNSFVQVKEAIQEILKEVPKIKFCGILIANKNDQAREIAYEEGLKLKTEYSLSWFVETNIFIEAQTPQITRKIEELIT